MASTSARSSLEAMLDTIRRRDEQPKDLPPALPTRPISRGRLPSTRRSLPVNFALKSNGNDMNLALPERGVELKEERGAELKEESELKGGFFARVEKSSDIMMPTPESYRKRKEADEPVDHKCSSASFAVNQILDVIELKNGVLKVEAELKRKEEENSSLRQQLQQHETRWEDYYGKTKSLEETWEKQITSLKMSLAAAKRSLATNDVTSIAGRPDASPNNPFFDSEDAMSVENYTTVGTPATRSSASGAGLNRTSDGLRNTIGCLVKEFEERRQIFEDEAGFLVEVKSGMPISNLNPDEELSKLKAQFVSWKKNFKVRLRETKLALQKHGSPETRKMRRKWWGNWSSK